MKIILDINKDYIIEKLEYFFRALITFAYKWLSEEGEILGHILAVFHVMISATVFLLLFISHTFLPLFSLQLFAFICLFIIWIQHVTLKVCIIIVAEKMLTQNISPYVELLKKLLNNFGIPVEKYTTYFILCETTAVMCFGLELLSNIINYMYVYFM